MSHHLCPAERKPKDRDFLRTREGLFFCVTGYLHPPDRYTAFLKYSPHPAGRWRRLGVAYRREITYYHTSNVAETIRHLERDYPHYVSDCPVRNIRFSMVPAAHVARYYVPQKRLQEILVAPHDPLEADARGLALEIARRADVEPGSIGVTGSILIGLHHPTLSDVNLAVYGLDNARKVRAALREARSPHIQGLDADLRERWVHEMTEWFPLTREEACYNVSRRWNYGFYGGRFFGIHPTRTDVEIAERYGDHIYHSLGIARIRATVTEGEEALFQPAIYRVGDICVLEGAMEAVEVREIVSYEGRYRDLVEVGEMIEARGKLESVDGQSYRLVIGAISSSLAGKAYLKPWR